MRQPTSPATPGMMPFQEAVERLTSALKPLNETVELTLDSARGMTLAETIKAPLNLPPADNSAMDGYAVASLQPESAHAGGRYLLRGEILAGQQWQDKLAPGECVRIMTGAETPPGTTTVVMQENTRQEADIIVLQEDSPAGNNIRPCGDDVAQGAVVLSPGKVLGVGDLGLLAALGVRQVSVVRPVRVALLATGDELRLPEQMLAPGQIYESNRLTVKLLLQNLPIELTDLGIVADDRATLKATLQQAMSDHDLVVSTGGVSVGMADYTREVLTELGEVDFWKVAIKPGKPVAFGRLGKGWFFGLPGNPVSALVTAHQLLVPAIEQLAGRPPQTPLTVKARVTQAFTKKPGRLDFQRARLTLSADGEYTVSPVSGQGSHMLWSFSQANAYCPLAADSTGAEVGATVSVVPFRSDLTGR